MASVDWEAKLTWAEAEHERRLASVAGPTEREDFRLAGLAGASWAAGLAALMLGRDDEARDRLLRAADEYDTSWPAAPPGSWGRPIAMIRCRLMAGDLEGARRRRLGARRRRADVGGPIGGYCAALALLVLGRDEEAEIVAARIADEGLEPGRGRATRSARSRGPTGRLRAASRAVLRSFEERDEFLEDVRVADTVLVLEALARERGLDLPPLSSPLLPG